jgi:hypothetical protein
MIRLGRRVSLVAVLLLFTSAAMASAECAWVFWIKRDYDAALEGDWTVLQARATRHDCIAALQEEFRDAIEAFKERGKAAGAEGMARAAQIMDESAARGTILLVGRGQSIAGKCLPDTIDPRGPKGAGR